MQENFKYYKLTKQHKKLFVLHQVALFIIIAIMTLIAINVTNPEVSGTSDKMSLTIGATLGVSVMILAFFNRLKSLLKIKFVAFLIVWVLLFSLQMIMGTLIWAIGLVLIPLMIDDVILVPMWNRLWYNSYERED